MCSVQLNSINFRGGETCGSPAKIANTAQSQESKNVNFRKQPDYDVYEGNKKSKTKKALIITGTTLGTVALGILGLGYLGKSGKIKNIETKWIKSILEPVTDTCYNWCKSIKGFFTNLWPKGKK